LGSGSGASDKDRYFGHRRGWDARVSSGRGVIEEANKRGAKVALIGDPEQLQAIEAGAAFRAVINQTSYIELTEIWRQKADWQKEATIQFATQQTGPALEQYYAHDCLHEHATQSQAKEAMVDAWNDVRIANPDKTQIMLAYTRVDAGDLNQMARSLRHSLGELGEDHSMLTEKGERIFAEGDRVYFLKNDRDLGVKNGNLGTIMDIDADPSHKQLTVQLDKQEGDRPINVTFSLDRYNQLDYGYAATLHKGQGVTVDHAYLLASEYLDRHATYVAMTRHTDVAQLYWSKEVFPSYDDMTATLSRERSKDSTLNYAVEHQFARDRGIDLMSSYSGYESYPNDLGSTKQAFNAPAGFEDLFTPSMLDKINGSKTNDFSDLFIGRELNNNKENHAITKAPVKDLGDDGMEL
jgi:ATP-dependent exoDNAse (exonuclease V) alpha subunit